MADDTNMDDWADAMSEQQNSEADSDTDWDAAFAEQADVEGGEMERPELEQLQAGSDNTTIEDASLEVILDIPVTVSMEVGKSKISIRNLLKLNQGSVVELDRLAGEPLDVLVNGTLIAHGEVVVVNEKYGIRLTDVISAAERIQKLK